MTIGRWNGMPGFSNFDPFMTGTYLNKTIHANYGFEKDHYERAMRPLVREAEWREANFYSADKGPKNTFRSEPLPGFGGKLDSSVQPPVQSTAIAPGPLASLDKAAGDFREFVMPGGQVDIYRAGVVVGLVALSAVVLGFLWQKR